MSTVGMISADLAGVTLGDGYPVRVVGVINVSPESFYQGSVRTEARDLVEMARSMVAEGADFLDIGAMSTAPYLRTDVPVKVETRRLAAAIEEVCRAVDVPISADTKRSGPAQAAIDAGATIINDVSGLKNDPKMAELVARQRVGLILMACEHPTPAPQLPTPLHRIISALQGSLAIAEKAGIPRESIVIDPGIGFFRETGIPWYEWDCQVLRELGSLRELGQPLHVGVSRKSFIGKILHRERPEDRFIGSLSVAAIAVYNGAHAIRTHDVRATVEAVRIAERLRPALPR